MGKPTGFLELKRELPPDRSPLERIQDWGEFHEEFPAKKLRDQGARCMDCGMPFCHTGDVIAGMATGCPIHNLIPEWNDLVYRGRWKDALDRLHQTNNFPEFTGRVCPAPCEGSCVLGIIDPPVTIKTIEVRDHRQGLRRGLGRARAARSSARGKKVAVVGSGPAGLAAAAQLNRAGHLVTVFERADRIGGLLMYGIPNMKLDKSARASGASALMAAEGRRVPRPASTSARTIPADQLKAEFDAIVLCGGATLPRDLPIAGRELAGIHFAMEFLHKNTKSLLDSNLQDGQFISAAGQGRGRHRRRRHRHRLRGHLDAARLPQPGPARDPAQAARSSAPPTTPGRSGPRSTSSTTARRRRRRSSAPTRATTASRPSASSATRDGRVQAHRDRPHRVGARERPLRDEGDRGLGADAGPRPSCSWPWASWARSAAGMLDQLGVTLDAPRQRGHGSRHRHDQRARRLRRGRHAARPVARGVGHRRRPRGRPARAPVSTHAALASAGR